MLYGNSELANGPNVPSVEGIYCFPWGDLNSIAAVQWTNCAGDGKLSVAMSLDKFNEFIAAAGGSTAGTSSPFTAEEIAALKFQAANPSPFNLSSSEGALIAGAVVAVWAVAWGVRQLVRTLGVSDSESQE